MGKINFNEQHYKRKVLEFSLLFEISQTLSSRTDLKEIIDPVLKLIAENLGMFRVTLTILNRQTGEIFIESAFGLSMTQKERGKYRIGEGVTGMVVKTGEPVLIPRVSKEPLFLNKTRARKDIHKDDISFICVPVKLGKEIMGALSVDKPFSTENTLDEDFRLLTIISSLIAQAVRFIQALQEDRQKLMEDNARLKERLMDQFKPANIVGTSHVMQKVYELIAHVANSDTTVLLRGESGTGKELIAHAIHYNSNRSDKALIKVNCAALPETVIESELFGHERGAFTGAITTRKGRFELANKGTIFLDEIGDLSVNTQIKLLRILQEKEFQRVGGSITFKTDVRVIAATNQDLERLIQENKFREDLYYRLNVFPIYIPPLRERMTDIILLANHFIEKYNKLNNKNVNSISDAAMNLLMAYHWPGNVRELENCIERAVLLSTDNCIHSHILPPSIQKESGSKMSGHRNLQEILDNMERRLLLDALKDTKGNMSKAAKILGISERKIGLRLSKYGFSLKEFRKLKK
jgi:Nif-specific regulatory protein